MARTSFSAREAHIVVSTDGYFDVYPASARSNGDKPAYRGRIAEKMGLSTNVELTRYAMQHGLVT